MSSTALAISFTGLIIILGVLLSILSKRKNAPFTVILLIVGLLLGPVMGLFTPGNYSGIVEGLVTLALVVILFDAGYEIPIRGLLNKLLVSSKLTTFGVLFTVLFGALVGRFMLGLEWVLALLLGTFIASTDLTIIAPTLKDLKFPKVLKEELNLEGTLNSVLAAILVILLVNIIQAGSITLSFAAGTFFYHILVGLAIGVVMGYVLVQIIKKIPLPDMPHLLSLGSVLFVYAITELIGGSGIMAALIIGMMFGNAKSKLPKIIKSFGGEIQLLLVTFVFIILGALLDFSVFVTAAGATIVFIASTFASRFINIKLSVPKLDINTQNLLFIASPRGIICAVLTLSYASLFPNPALIIGLVFSVVFVTSISTFFLPAFINLKK